MFRVGEGSTVPVRIISKYVGNKIALNKFVSNLSLLIAMSVWICIYATKLLYLTWKNQQTLSLCLFMVTGLYWVCVATSTYAVCSGCSGLASRYSVSTRRRYGADHALQVDRLWSVSCL